MKTPFPFIITIFFLLLTHFIYASNSCPKWYPMPNNNIVVVIPIYDATIIESDLDCDGIIDDMDRDMDGDGVINSEDAFPEDASESVDTDGDGIGDNADNDDDNDGIKDDEDEPVAYPIELVMDINASNIAVTLSGHDNDSVLSYEIIRFPSYGLLTGIAPNLKYTPQRNYRGKDYFTYRVSDGVHKSHIVTVMLYIGIESSYQVESTNEASCFLSRATFGATIEGIEALKNLNNYKEWIEDQVSKTPSYHLTWILEHAKGVNGIKDLKNDPEGWTRYSDALERMQRDAWWDIVVNGDDQLRQRVAFALSGILVISRNGPLMTFPDVRVSYYDVLVKDAFGNFETLLRDVTYHPAMGKYLSYLGNAKANYYTAGSHPDENYAREVMQLFTIGLYELNMDGTKKLKGGKPIATYTQTDIREMAKVFTGLSDDNGQLEAEASFESHHARTAPMVAFEEAHDTSEKRILHGTKVIPAGGNTQNDIKMALHILFMHPNTAPFISKQLIQRLVTSNPSPAYIERVARVFADNGEGVRGDLKAVIKAILLDDEALRKTNRFDHFGKFREPLLYISHLFRVFHAQNGEHILTQEDTELYKYRSFNFNGTGMTKQEGPLEALTVFNYFTPDDGPATLKKEGLVAPELELYGKQGIDDVLMGLITKNEFVYRLYNITAELQFDTEKALVHAKKFDALLDRLDLILTGGNLSTATRDAIKKYMQKHATLDDETLVRYTIGLVMTSPDYALQR